MSATPDLEVGPADRLGERDALGKVPLLALGLAGSLLFLRRAETEWSLKYLLSGLLLESVVGLFLLVQGILGDDFVGDKVAALIGLAALGVPLLVQALVERVLKK